MRYGLLLRSVQKLLPDGEHVQDAAYMWQRHPWTVAFATGSAVLVFLVGRLLSFDAIDAGGIGVLVGVVAGSASTSYFVAARTTEGVVILRASRIRRVAREFLRRLSPSETIVPVDGTVLASDWSIGGEIYTVPKSAERSIQAIAT